MIHMGFVFKIKYQNTLRRLTIEEGKDGSLGIIFVDLVAKIHNMFGISCDERLVITYTDEDNDVVTMGDDQDLHDACIVQRISPLRIHVKVDNYRSNHTTTEAHKSSFQDPLIANYRMEELISLMDNWHTKGTSPDKVRDAVASYSSRAQANVLWREAETSDTTPSEPCTVDNISRRVSRIFHKGAQCAGCGKTPIVGPRFKSTRREDYDLCCSCFIETGNKTEFQRIDRPVLARKNHHHQFRAGGRSTRHRMSFPLRCTSSSWKQDWGTHSPFCANGMALAGGDHNIKKLDARFVRDVTIFDGTEMVAGTHFTKIWRLRNIGMLPWPHATRLVYTGGDVLGSDKSSSVELPEEGLCCGEEINVSVDLVAPQSPGRYTSHWRLQAPSGQKFGQRIWVLFQVASNCTQSISAHAATEGRFSVGNDFNIDVPSTCEARLSSQVVVGKPAQDMIKSNRDGLGACDATFSSQLVVDVQTPAQDCQDMVRSDHDGLGAYDTILSSQLVVDMHVRGGSQDMASKREVDGDVISLIEQVHQNVEDWTICQQAVKPLVSLDMIGSQSMESTTREDQEKLSSLGFN